MSNIYIQEPPTFGKVLLKTSSGDIDIELWSKECPKTCRNFVQLCMEGYFNGTVFHRVVKGFIVQGGDPNGDGTGGESIYGQTFKDEFHSRLRYARRGLVGMANSGVDDNGSQFFFTMAPTPELQNKNTLFAKVTGDTVFNMLKLEDGLVDQNERPMYLQRILRTEILHNPFDDITPRVQQADEKKEKKRKREKGVKNFGLLSFGEEAEEDEDETNTFVQKNAGKAKSMHDVVDDPMLSKNAVEIETTNVSTTSEEDELPEDRRTTVTAIATATQVIKEKLTRDSAISASKTTTKKPKTGAAEADSDSDADVLLTQEHDKRLRSEKKKEEIRQEIQSLKKQYQTDKRMKDELLEKKTITDGKASSKDLTESAESNEFIKNFIDEKEKYSGRKSQLPKKGAGRESFTLSLLSKFRNKLEVLKEQKVCETEAVGHVDETVVEREIQGDDWLAHTLKFEDQTAAVLAKDASTKGDDWYNVYDPRNPLNKRKRGEGANTSPTKRRR